jgi:hypothetical protein
MHPFKKGISNRREARKVIFFMFNKINTAQSKYRIIANLGEEVTI